MKVIKEKVLGTRGSWLFRGRVVEYTTKEQGRFSRAEILMDKTGPEDVGFTEEDIAQIHAMLVQYKRENMF